MRSRTRNWIQFGIVLAVIAGTQTGCKSGWKMPSSDMFSWGRKPDSTVIGSGPTVTSPGVTAQAAPKPTGTATSPSTNSPLSPSLRSTPNQINSTALNQPAATRPNSSNLGGYGPNMSVPTTPGVAGTVPSPGVAATSNGYTTGAYATNQARMGNMPTGPYGQATPFGQAPSMPAPQMPVPQMPLPQMTASQMQGPQMPGPQMPAPQMQAPQMPAPQMQVAQGNMPSQQLPGGPGFSYPLPSGPVPQGPSLVAGAPNAAMPPAGTPNGFSMIPPPAGTQPLPAMPVSGGASLPPSLPPTTQMPVAYGGGAPSSMPTVAPQNAARSGAYQPGSIGRTTSYDFSNQGPGSVPTAPANTLPRTATDPSGSWNR